MNKLPSLLGTGMDRLARAARLVEAELRTVRRWLEGYSWKCGDGRKVSGPLWTLQHAQDKVFGDEQVLGFQDLLKLGTVARFIEQGVSLLAIRATIDIAREPLGNYPLHSKRFVTDGKRIFFEAVKPSSGRAMRARRWTCAGSSSPSTR
jgi:hypothetical protein